MDQDTIVLSFEPDRMRCGIGTLDTSCIQNLDKSQILFDERGNQSNLWGILSGVNLEEFHPSHYSLQLL